MVVVAGFSAQVATVHRNYAGKWTGLFCIGAEQELPSLPSLSDAYRFPGSGFDGQFYLLIAHDPLGRREIPRYIDWPGLRYFRILMPALAGAASADDDSRLAAAYIGWNLAFLGLGVYWSARFAELSGRPAWWGAGFALVPAVSISLDRLTVDLALLSLTAGVAYFWSAGRFGWAAALMAPAVLARETGILIPAGFLVHFALNREWRRLAITALTTVPAGLWYALVASRLTTNAEHWLPADRPFSDLWIHIRDYAPSPYPFPLDLFGRAVDLASLAGIGAAVWFCLVRLRREDVGPMDWVAWAYSGLMVYLLGHDGWTHVYDYGRLLAPALLWLMMLACGSRQWYLAAPAAAMTLRVWAQMTPQLLGILGWNR